jgi:Leucine-rich repeat (LRR) protein
MISILDKVIQEYESDPSKDNFKKIMNSVNEIEYKICYNYELSIIGRQDLNNINKNGKNALLEKISLLEKKISLINYKFDINLTGNEIIINLNGRNVTNIDLELLCGINFKYLEEMNLGNNNISNLEELKNLKSPNLKVLNLNNNKIKDVTPLKSTSLPKLQKLDLSFNKIQDITPLGDMMNENRQIQLLNLDNNEIRKVEPLKNNISINVKDISLDNNQLIQKDIEEIKNIISENKILAEYLKIEENEKKIE